MHFVSKADKIQGYAIHISWNQIDENSTYPLLTALAWSSEDKENICDGSEKIWEGTFQNTKMSNCDYAENVWDWSHEEIYGDHRESIHGGQKIRELQSQSKVESK